MVATRQRRKAPVAGAARWQRGGRSNVGIAAAALRHWGWRHRGSRGGSLAVVRQAAWWQLGGGGNSFASAW